MPSASASAAEPWPQGRRSRHGDRRWTLSAVPPRLDAVPCVRRHARDVLHLWGLPEVTADVELLLTELVTNAVEHARTSFTVSMSWLGWHLRCEVSDALPVLPHPQLALEPERTRGRGYLLLDSMSGGWGVEVHDDGKTVWFTLPVRRSPGADPRSGG